MSTQLFVDNMAALENDVDGAPDGNGTCSEACTWKDRKCNIALITGITGQVHTFIDSTCHSTRHAIIRVRVRVIYWVGIIFRCH